ncbi:MAG: hypothetical protein AAFR58_04165 [Cyanobacteria bacterium J06627_28]
MSNVLVSVQLSDPNLSDDRLQSLTENVLSQVKQFDGVNRANLKADEVLPSGAKSLGNFSLGFLTAEIDANYIGNLFMFLGERLTGQRTIELEVESNSRKLKVKVHSREELAEVIGMAENFVSAK